MRRVWLAAGLVWLSAACASKPVKKADLVLIDQADARVLEGCYDCLIDARTAYVKLAAGKARPVILPRLFEVELLLTLREKELDLDFAPSLARARDLLKELPAPLEAARYVALVEGIPSDEIGIPRAEMGRFRQAAAKTFVPTVDAEIQWLSTAVGFSQPFRQYLSLAADCMYLRAAAAAGATAVCLAQSRSRAGRAAARHVSFRDLRSRHRACTDRARVLDRPEIRRGRVFPRPPRTCGSEADEGARAAGPCDQALSAVSGVDLFQRQFQPAHRRLQGRPRLLRRDDRAPAVARERAAGPRHLPDLPEAPAGGDSGGDTHHRSEARQHPRGLLLARVELPLPAATGAGAVRHRGGEADAIDVGDPHARRHHRTRSGRSRARREGPGHRQGHVGRRAELHGALVSGTGRDEA